MGGVCNYCGGEFPGAGPGTKWPHDTELCLRETFKQQKAQLEDLVHVLLVYGNAGDGSLMADKGRRARLALKKMGIQHRPDAGQA